MSESRAENAGIVVLARSSNTLSDLPENVIESILMCLPTRDAVRTSILGRKWRYRWAKLPQLILDKTLWSKLRIEHPDSVKLARILCHLLLLRERPIKKFRLAIPELKSCPEIDNLIHFLSRNGVEDVTLVMRSNERYKLPETFYKCHQLRHLGLWSCLIETTLEFKGFSRLTTLKLRDVVISAKVLGCLVSNSPFLEHLELTSLVNFCDLDIVAPKLKDFAFKGKLGSLVFNYTPLLASVSIVTHERLKGRDNLVLPSLYLDNLFHGLRGLEFLHLNNKFLQMSTYAWITEKLEATLVRLKTLKLSDITLSDSNVLSSVLWLIMSSPNLMHLDVHLDDDDVDVNSSSDTSHECMLFYSQLNKFFKSVMVNELKQVKLHNVIGTRRQLELVEFLLAKSSSLKMMLINHRRNNVEEECKVLREVIRFGRASREAQVVSQLAGMKN